MFLEFLSLCPGPMYLNALDRYNSLDAVLAQKLIIILPCKFQKYSRTKCILLRIFET